MSGERAARLFYAFCGLAGAAVLAATFLSAIGAVPIAGGYATVFRTFVFRGGIVLAGGVFALAVLLRFVFRRDGVSGVSPRSLAFAASTWTIRGLCVSTALAFLATEVGKLAHPTEMRAFFTGSGYPAWLLYVVIGVETIGAIGLLEPRVRLVAALGLGFVMVGAIVTHARNSDPFTDSLEAAHLLVTLLTILGIAVLRERLPAGGVIESGPTTRRTR